MGNPYRPPRADPADGETEEAPARIGLEPRLPSPRSLAGYAAFIAALQLGYVATSSEPLAIADLRHLGLQFLTGLLTLPLVYGLVWVHLASRTLGVESTPVASIDLVGRALFQPAVLGCGLGLLVALGALLGGTPLDEQGWLYAGNGFKVICLAAVVRTWQSERQSTPGRAAVLVVWIVALVLLWLYLPSLPQLFEGGSVMDD